MGEKSTPNCCYTRVGHDATRQQPAVCNRPTTAVAEQHAHELSVVLLGNEISFFLNIFKSMLFFTFKKCTAGLTINAKFKSNHGSQCD